MVDVVSHDGGAPMDGHYSAIHGKQRCQLAQEFNHDNRSKKVS
jgi:hypothetical protein